MATAIAVLVILGAIVSLVALIALGISGARIIEDPEELYDAYQRLRDGGK